MQVLQKLAHLFGTVVKKNRLDIPEKFGRGYCTGFVFNEHIRMLILNYELNSDIIIENPDVNVTSRTIFFKFQNIFRAPAKEMQGNRLNVTPSVLIATKSLIPEAVISVHTNTATINIEVDAGYLNGLFDSSEKSPVLKSLLQNVQPLLFEELIYTSLQKIADEILSESVDETFKLFFLRVKSEELICRLLMELEKRDEKRIYDLNTQDINTIYKVKEEILKQLDIPPEINNLAVYAGMSPTKLKRLFKQIFGNSIFNYYQQFRMKEAASLLKNEKLSVADAGYRLGFTNLSHFARVFKDHLGVKPKQYSKY